MKFFASYVLNAGQDGREGKGGGKGSKGRKSTRGNEWMRLRVGESCEVKKSVHDDARQFRRMFPGTNKNERK